MVTPIPGSARTQVSDRARTLTSPQRNANLAPARNRSRSLVSALLRRLVFRERVVPPQTGGLHCGQMSHRSMTLGLNAVVPPLTGGLHCGWIDAWKVIKSSALSSRP